MKKAFILFILSFVFYNCVTTNSAGYKIKAERPDDLKFVAPDGSTFRTNVGGFSGWPYYEVYCNKEAAFVITELNGLHYLSKVQYDGKKYYIFIDKKRHEIDVDKIIPESVAITEFDKIVKEKTGFNTLAEFNRHRENERKEAEEKRKNEEMEEKRRLRTEIDQRFGVTAIVSMYDAKSGKLNIGSIYRLNDTFFSTFPFRESKNGGAANFSRRDTIKGNSGQYIFGEFQEFEVKGIDMQRIDLKDVKKTYNIVDITGYPIGSDTYTCKVGYIVKYLGTEQILTKAGLQKVIWVFECISGNNYAE